MTEDRVQIITDGAVVEETETDDPLTFIEEFQQRFDVAEADGLPRFFGGLVGYFSYDTVRYVEKASAAQYFRRSLDTP